MQLVLDSNGLKLTKRNKSFYVYHKTQGRRLISPHRISSIAVVRDCLISSAALRLAVQHGIPVFFCTATGKAEGAVYSASYANLTTLRRQQVLWAEDERGTAVVVEWFGWKTAGQVAVMRKFSAAKVATVANYLHGQQRKIQQHRDQPIAAVRNSMMGLEGTASRYYWRAVNQVLPTAWKFATRSRRPATDCFNAALNYLYGMLYNVVENAIRDVGLDPYFGFMHVDGYQRPALVFDLIEPFRPWVDELLIGLVQERPRPPQSYFKTITDGIW